MRIIAISCMRQIRYLSLKCVPAKPPRPSPFMKEFHAPTPTFWPRTREQLSRLAGDGLLFGARITNSREIVGLCYLTADERGGRVGNWRADDCSGFSASW